MAEVIESESRAGEEGTAARQVAKVYAEALLDVADKLDIAEQVGAELQELNTQLRQSPDVAKSLVNPLVKRTAKAPVIAAAFKGKSSDLLADFVEMLNKKDRLSLLAHIAPAYRGLLNERAKRLHVTVRSVTPLSPDQLEHLRQTVGHAYGREPMIEAVVDESLLGGLIVQVGDEVFDSSVRTRVNNLRNQLLARSSHEIQVGRDRFSTAG